MLSSEVSYLKNHYGKVVGVNWDCGQRRRSRCYRQLLHLCSDQYQKEGYRNRKSTVAGERPCDVDWRYYCVVRWKDIGEGCGKGELSEWGLGAPKG